ncbi:MAG: N-acetylmuramic acid 6-phosphate etherase [Candidatus Marinimicrobia bacterium]|nr:N-acetylmuramic acid 6-phosphate etherase [Candidatus Neomarinimicrobiota bacterium]
MEEVKDRSEILTEKKNPKSEKIDTLSTEEIIRLINEEDATVHQAVKKAIPEITRAADIVYNAFSNEGRLRYIGAGTSGRLGVLDASECPPTFSVDPDLVQGIIAGGYQALRKAVEAAEDDPENGKKDCIKYGLQSSDVLMGIATGGTTPYVHGAIDYANSIDCKTIFMTCTHKEKLDIEADVIIEVLVGPELVTGSTRMKAGTATKMVLNMITTTAMIKLGKVFGNYMVDHMAINEKLLDRGSRIIADLANVSREEGYEYLHKANKHVKEGIVMAKLDVSYDKAHQLIQDHNGFIRFAFEEEQT